MYVYIDTIYCSSKSSRKTRLSMVYTIYDWSEGNEAKIHKLEWTGMQNLPTLLNIMLENIRIN